MHSQLLLWLTLSQDDSVKQQILNLAVKLFLSNPKQTSNLFKVGLPLTLFVNSPEQWPCQ